VLAAGDGPRSCEGADEARPSTWRRRRRRRSPVAPPEREQRRRVDTGEEKGSGELEHSLKISVGLEQTEYLGPLATGKNRIVQLSPLG